MIFRVRRFLIRLLGDSRAQDMVEYGLLAGFVAVASAATLPPVAEDINRSWPWQPVQTDFLSCPISSCVNRRYPRLTA